MVTSRSIICKEYSIYGNHIRVQSYRTLNWLDLDFAFFKTTPPGPPIFHRNFIELKIFPLAMANIPPLQQYLTFKEAKVFKSFKTKWIKYTDKAWLKLDKTNGELFVDDSDLEQELSYLFLQSQMGLFWDNCDLHRIHCLSFVYKDKGNLLLLPSGGGKSTLALEMLNNKEFKILGDDFCLIDKDLKLWPLPFRFSFTEFHEIPQDLAKKTIRWQRRKFGAKLLLSTDHIANHILDLKKDQTIVCANIFVGKRWNKSQPAKASKANLFSALRALFRELIIGIGLPQVAEIILSNGLSGTIYLGSAFFKRSLLACALLRNCNLIKLELSANSRDNLKELIRYLATHEQD